MRFNFLIPSLAALLAVQSQASDFWITTNEYSVSLGSSVENEQWVYANTADVSGTFENDLFIGTPAVLDFSGIYQGNIWATSLMGIQLAGSAGQNVRIYSPTVRIDGTIAGNLIAMGNTVVLSSNAVIHGSAWIYSLNNIVQEGVIEGDAALSAPRMITFAGNINGDVTADAPEMLFTRDARIKGNLHYGSPDELSLREGTVAGEVSRKEPSSLFEPKRLQKILFSFLAALIAGVPFISLFPMTTAMSAQLIKRSPWKCLLAGFITSIALPFFGMMSLSSLIGIPLGVMILASWGAMVYLSRIIMALVIGNLFLKKMGNSIGKVLAAMAIGLALIYAATVFPTIGIPVQIMVLWLGMGSLIVALIEKRRLILQVPANLQKLQTLRDENYKPEEDDS